jgi:hypothetical protein
MSTLPVPSTALARLIVRGANAIKDRPSGMREGRIRDPLGHLCILSQQVGR